ncbi:unnamed protein product [Adineta ricciae]|uniref:F-box domain-containing protein n=1 Tax=Adineta ricciae TaxID=249248 RepID=A0A815LZD1_ADIRI|nr:unnamed protein product [Adineta ricciae]
MNLESLPNEVLLTCFEYINAIDLFLTFDQLNFRFRQLIRTVRLSLDLYYVHKCQFHRLCQTMLEIPEIKSQIHSLHLSNQGTAGEIHAFLSLFSLEQFPNLHSLSLTSIRKHDVPHLQSMLPSLSKLTSFRLSRTRFDEQILRSLPTIHLRRLSLSKASRTHYVLNLPQLRYLNIENIRCHFHVSVHLTTLILSQLMCRFDDLESYLSRAPALKHLTILAPKNRQLADANCWQDLITKSLCQLQTFKFIFAGHSIEQYKKFQSDFWTIEHRWYTEYIQDGMLIYIYTISYPLNELILSADFTRCKNPMISDVDVFDNVTELTLLMNFDVKTDEFYFNHIRSVILKIDGRIALQHEQSAKTITKMINLFNLKHICIHQEICADVVIELLRQSPQLTSLSISPQMLILFIRNRELCQYFTEKIRIFNIVPLLHPIFIGLKELRNICSIFSNLVQFKCRVNTIEEIVIILQSLTKLTSLRTSLDHADVEEIFLTKVKEQRQQLNLSYTVEYEDNDNDVLCFWIDREPK